VARGEGRGRVQVLKLADDIYGVGVKLNSRAASERVPTILERCGFVLF